MAIKVVSSTKGCTTFDELRFENYTSKETSLIYLLSTFNSIKCHLYRCLFIIQEQTSIYNKTKDHADPCEFVCVIDRDATLRPHKMLLLIPLPTLLPSDVGANQNAPNNASVK